MSSKYSVYERIIARLLSQFPTLKFFIKRSYQKLNSILYKKKYTFLSEHKIYKLNDTGEAFFGYYDKSPLSSGGRYILYYSSDSTTKELPNPQRPLGINVFDVQSGKTIWSSRLSSYNWQQGARAQWISETKFIYNIFDESDHKYKSKIIDIRNGGTFVYPFPIYDCKGEEFGISLNFRRLMELRPDYGYRNLAKMSLSELKDLDRDGVFYCDLKSGRSKLIVPLSRLYEISTTEEMSEAFHKVNHIMISPDGEYFIFLHRYFVNKRRRDRLFVSNKDGSKISLLVNYGMVSHCCWLDNEHVVGYWRGESGDRYYKLNIHDKIAKPLGIDIIDKYGDGHPSVHGAKMIFDTYPDKSRMKQLFLYDLQNDRLKVLGEFYESLEYYGETRCDLHPRFSGDGSKVFFDSVHEGKRGLYWIEL